mgnify:CR=1 FL=1
MDELRSKLKDKKRVVVKIGSSSLQHPETGDLDYIKMDILCLLYTSPSPRDCS